MLCLTAESHCKADAGLWWILVQRLLHHQREIPYHPEEWGELRRIVYFVHGDIQLSAGNTELIVGEGVQWL